MNSFGNRNFMQPMGRLCMHSKCLVLFSFEFWGEEFFHFSLVPNMFPSSSQWVPQVLIRVPNSTFLPFSHIQVGMIVQKVLMCISTNTSGACAIGPSVTTSSTDISFQNLVFWNLFEFSVANAMKPSPCTPPHRELSKDTKNMI